MFIHKRDVAMRQVIRIFKQFHGMNELTRSTSLSVAATLFLDANMLGCTMELGYDAGIENADFESKSWHCVTGPAGVVHRELEGLQVVCPKIGCFHRGCMGTNCRYVCLVDVKKHILFASK